MILWFAFAFAVAVAGQSTTDVRLIGYYVKPDYTFTWRAGKGWSTSGTVAGDCVPPSTCVLHTTCTSNTLFFDNGTSTTCDSDKICVTATFFERFPFEAPTATNWDCRPSRSTIYSTLYRNLPASPTSEITVYSTVSPTTTMTSSGTPSATSSPSPSASPMASSSGGGSKAWIAGAVVGPIAGVGLCGAAYWLWMRRRNNHDRHPSAKPEDQPQIADTRQDGAQPEFSGAHVAPAFMLPTDAVRKTPELPG